MSDLYWLTDEQMERLRPHFPKSHGKPRVDDRRVLSGIIFVNRNGLRWRDAPPVYGPHKTLYNRWKRWSEAGVFIRMMEGLSGHNAERRTVMIDATYLKAHRTASSLALILMKIFKKTGTLNIAVVLPVNSCVSLTEGHTLAMSITTSVALMATLLSALKTF